MPPDVAALFARQSLDREAYRRVLRQPKAKTRYVVYFTPRSGSTFLTNICIKSGRLGEPREFFNPNHVHRFLERMSACNLEQYVQTLMRMYGPDVFACEVTWPQIKHTFGGRDRFMAFFLERACFCLTRDDLVAQAVSLAKMRATGVSHVVGRRPEEITAADASFAYDAAAIATSLRRLASQERRLEAMFAVYGVRPHRLVYEEITSAPVAETLARMARHLGIAPEDAAEVISDHRKLGTAKNIAFAERFRAENAAMVADIEAARPPRRQ